MLFPCKSNSLYQGSNLRSIIIFTKIFHHLSQNMKVIYFFKNRIQIDSILHSYCTQLPVYAFWQQTQCMQTLSSSQSDSLEVFHRLSAVQTPPFESSTPLGHDILLPWHDIFETRTLITLLQNLSKQFKQHQNANIV